MSVNASLGNTFIPKIPPTLTYRLLSQISADGLANLCLLWSSIPQTLPSPSREQIQKLDLTKEELQKDFVEFVESFKRRKSKNKKKLIDRILVDFYNNGLNLLQFAQLDSQVLVEKPLNFFWKSNKLLNSESQEQVLNIHEPQIFLNNLLKELSQFYLNHIYISRHPHYPLVIIRIQLFDLVSDISVTELKKLTTSSSIVSRKPFFLALPLNSSNLISSYQTSSSTDLTSNIVLQAVESALSQTLSKQIRIDRTSSNQQPIRSLESLHIIKGNSRFSESLGIWTPYADGTVDISPFDDVLNHESFKELPTIEDTDDRIKKIAMLRFKGSLDPLKSKKLYVDVENSDVEEEKRYKRRKLIGDDVDDNEEERNVDKSEFSSLTPIQFIDFEISNEYKNFLPKVKIKLQGNDIFAGLHELSVNGTINPETIPGWLTGEEGLNSGVIEDHLFVEKTIPASASNDLI